MDIIDELFSDKDFIKQFLDKKYPIKEDQTNDVMAHSMSARMTLATMMVLDTYEHLGKDALNIALDKFKKVVMGIAEEEYK